MDYGDKFQLLSKYERNKLRGKMLDWDNKPAAYKIYPSDLKRFELDKPEKIGGEPLYSILGRRRSVRDFRPGALDKKKLSQVLWAAQGVTQANEYHQFRTAPSAGALFPIETYCLINNVEGFDPGIYHYQVLYHQLILLKKGAFGHELSQAALGQMMIGTASFVIIWSALVERSKWKYDQRAYRYIYLDAGHIGQNAALAAVSCGLGSCQVGAFFDDEVNRIIDVDGVNETAVYMAAIGEII